MRPMRKRELEYIKRKLQAIMNSARMSNANFSAMGIDPEHGNLPTQESEVDEFIKERTKLYRNSWIVCPIAELIVQVDNALVGAGITKRLLTDRDCSGYRGWEINWHDKHEVWVAYQYGVTMNNSDLAGLRRMIDAKVLERQEARNATD